MPRPCPFRAAGSLTVFRKFAGGRIELELIDGVRRDVGTNTSLLFGWTIAACAVFRGFDHFNVARRACPFVDGMHDHAPAQIRGRKQKSIGSVGRDKRSVFAVFEFRRVSQASARRFAGRSHSCLSEKSVRSDAKRNYG